MEPSIQVYISADGKGFWQWQFYDLIIDTDHDFEWLGPNKSKHYRMRVVYYPKHPSHLAFDRPGRYWVKICFPFVRGKPHPQGEIESNTIPETTIIGTDQQNALSRLQLRGIQGLQAPKPGS